MLTKLTLECFKNFKHAELSLGPVTTVIGTNASGKSNLRDAFRFLHGIGRGYTLAEIMGEKYGEGGELQWKGIRGGMREVAYLQAEYFKVSISFSYHPFPNTSPEKSITCVYTIEIQSKSTVNGPEVFQESLYTDGIMLFASSPSEKPIHGQKLSVQLYGGNIGYFDIHRPAISQIPEYITTQHQHGIPLTFGEFGEPVITQKPITLENLSGSGKQADRNGIPIELIQALGRIRDILQSMRFFVLEPQPMRLPSIPGQIVLGDRGENLSSVLQAICEDEQKKQALVEWIRELTPMDAVDLEFIPDQTGRILLTLVEDNGRKTSAYSASDGTLRFLAIIAALLGPKPAKLLFFEELENGLHPSRLHLLLQVMERKASEGNIQIINTTHSPQFLRFLSPEALEHASLTYRLPESPEGRIRRLFDIPEARRLIEEQDIASLHDSGWFEDALYLDDMEEVV